MITDKLKELAVLKAKAATLEADIEKERAAALKQLPAEMGFDSLDSFISALNAAGGIKAGRGRKASASAKVGAVKKKGKRAKITPDMKEQVKKAVEAGKTGNDIAKALGISLPSVQNIKKEFGLVKKRK